MIPLFTVAITHLMMQHESLVDIYTDSASSLIPIEAICVFLNTNYSKDSLFCKSCSQDTKNLNLWSDHCKHVLFFYGHEYKMTSIRQASVKSYQVLEDARLVICFSDTVDKHLFNMFTCNIIYFISMRNRLFICKMNQVVG